MLAGGGPGIRWSGEETRIYFPGESWGGENWWQGIDQIRGPHMNDLIIWAQENVELVVAVGSAAVAVIGALLSGNAARRQHRMQKEQLRQNIDRMSMEWGGDAIDALADAIALAELCRTHLPDAEIETRKSSIAARISALVDKGRLFFPNIDPDAKGVDKEHAYRGSRPPILDALMYAYYEVRGLSRSRGPSPMDTAQFIFDCRRLLVSELQGHLDPRRQDEIVERYDRQNRLVREESLVQAGKLALMLRTRRPDLLKEIGNWGWADKVPEEDRRVIEGSEGGLLDPAATNKGESS